jgi:hypothetical protein
MQLKLGAWARGAPEIQSAVAGTFSTVVVAFMTSPPILFNELFQ